MTTPNTRLSKSIGALLGVHAGDSLGATLEFLSYTSIRARYPNGLRTIIGGGCFRWPAGHATDDTDLTRAVLLAYQDRETARSNGTLENFDLIRSAADHSMEWYDGNPWPGRKPGSSPRDMGSATSTGLANYESDRDPTTSGAGRGSAGNGSLMRCIPTALFTAEREERIAESMAISAITHDDERCTIACAAYNEIVAALIEGKSVEEAIGIGVEVVDKFGAQGTAVRAAIDEGRALSIQEYAETGHKRGGKFPDRTSGYVLNALLLAVAAIRDERGLEDILVDVVRLGGDTDTNGAIAGGALGARDGVDAIPESWRSILQFGTEFESVTREIAVHQGWSE